MNDTNAHPIAAANVGANANSGPGPNPSDIAEREAILQSLREMPVDAALAGAEAVKPDPLALPAALDGAESKSPSDTNATAAKATDASPSSTKPTDDPAPQSAYARSRERAAKTWAEVEAEKARLAEERKAFEADRARLSEQTAKAADHALNKYKPDQYDNLARQFDAEGRAELAQIARNEASRLRAEAQQTEAAAQRDALTRAWRANLTEQIKRHPELNDPASELHKRVDALLKRRPVLFSYAEGIDDAVDAARARLDADGAGKVRGEKTALENEVAALKRQLAEKEKLLQPAKGGPSAPPKLESFDEMTPAQQRAYLVRELQTADAGA